jgi:hypothetical protein
MFLVEVSLVLLQPEHSLSENFKDLESLELLLGNIQTWLEDFLRFFFLFIFFFFLLFWLGAR